jgi:hypothetical protein
LIGVHLTIVWQSGRMTMSTDRSMERIELSDLNHLAGIAADAEADLFARHPVGSGRYAGRLLCRVLGQGAALHYVGHVNGVKDFDVWSFYARRTDGPFPARWRGTADFGPSKFGRFPGDPPRYQGRRVDLTGPVTPHPARSRSGRRSSQLPFRRTDGIGQGPGSESGGLHRRPAGAGEIIWPDHR